MAPALTLVPLLSSAFWVRNLEFPTSPHPHSLCSQKTSYMKEIETEPHPGLRESDMETPWPSCVSWGGWGCYSFAYFKCLVTDIQALGALFGALDSCVHLYTCHPTPDENSGHCLSLWVLFVRSVPGRHTGHS